MKMERWHTWNRIRSVSRITWIMGNELHLQKKWKDSRSRSSGDLIMWHKYLGDDPRDLPAFPMKNPIFFISCPELIRVSEISLCQVLYCPSILIPVSSHNFCKTSSYSCIEVNDKHRVCPPLVSRRKIRSISDFIVIGMFAVTSRLWLVGREATTDTPLWPGKSVVFTRVSHLPELVFLLLIKIQDM